MKPPPRTRDVISVAGIEDAGLARSDAGLAFAEFDPNCAGVVMQDGRARRPGRADLGEEFESALRNVGETCRRPAN